MVERAKVLEDSEEFERAIKDAERDPIKDVDLDDDEDKEELWACWWCLDNLYATRK